MTCRPTAGSTGAAVPLAARSHKEHDTHSLISYKSPVALSAALSQRPANTSARSPAEMWLQALRLRERTHGSLASSEIFDQKGGSLCPWHLCNARSAISSKPIANDKSTFSTLDMMACRHGAKKGGYLMHGQNMLPHTANPSQVADPQSSRNAIAPTSLTALC